MKTELNRLVSARIFRGFATLACLVTVGTVHATEAPSLFQLTGRVVSVADGDTFTMLVKGHHEKVRLASIDAPEMTRSRRQPGQPMAQASKKSLAQLIAGKDLTLSCFEQDRHGRNICDVPLADGTTANRQQVARGMAWANMEGRGKFMRDPELRNIESDARRSSQGIWKESKAVAPWVWRYQCWKQSQC